MMDRTSELSVTRQCQMLALSRSSVYYTPKPIPEADLALMRRIDELHLEHPFLGSRQIKRMLVNEGHWIGRKHVATLMRRMGIEEHQPPTSRAHGISLPAAGLGD